MSAVPSPNSAVPPSLFATGRAPLAAEDPRLAELQRAAILLRATARTAADEAYYRGYASGISRRIAGGVGPDEPEVVAFELLQDAPGGLVQLLGRGIGTGWRGRRSH